MYERMLDKSESPSPQQIQSYLGEDAWDFLQRLEESLKKTYDLNRELKFPFGNNYGWGYKFSHKTKHLCYVFFEQGAVMVQLQLGGNLVSKVESVLSECHAQTKQAWDDRYPCGDGGWIYKRILSNDDLEDILKLIYIKQKPTKCL